MLTSSTLLPSIIKIFLMVMELYSRNENEVKIGSGDIIRKQRLAKLSFLYAALRVDLFYNFTKYRKYISNGSGVMLRKRIVDSRPPAGIHFFNNQSESFPPEIGNAKIFHYTVF